MLHVSEEFVVNELKSITQNDEYFNACEKYEYINMDLMFLCLSRNIIFFANIFKLYYHTDKDNEYVDISESLNHFIYNNHYKKYDKYHK